jgi:hypothetical protein
MSKNKRGRIRMKQKPFPALTSGIALACFLMLIMANGTLAFEYKKISGSWRIYPPSSSLGTSFRFAGSIENAPVKSNSAISPSSMKAAERIVSDEIFLLTHQGSTYNIWMALENEEGSFAINEIPHRYPNKNVATLNYAKQIYGEPNHISAFVFPNNETLPIYLWGPVFLMFANDQICQIGGWPSRIDKEKKASSSSLPDFDYEIMAGRNLVRIHNPNNHGVTIGFRSIDACKFIVGADSYIEAEKSITANLPPGHYELYLIFDDKPRSLFQGDLLTIEQSSVITGAKTKEIDIHLEKAVGGNYLLKKIR